MGPTEPPVVGRHRGEPARGQRLPAEERAESLRERVYVSFVSLAVVLTLGVHAEELRAGPAAATLTISALGTVAAAFAADLLSHVAVHGALATRPELRRMGRASFGALGALVVPLLLLGLAGLGAWSVDRALDVASFVLTATLGLVAWVGVRRTALPTWQKLAALAVFVLLGLAVIALKLLAPH